MQFLFISNGSLTQNLNSLSGARIIIQITDQNILFDKKIARHVLIHGLSLKFIFACSYWYTDHQIPLDNFFIDQPIGETLIKEEVDIYKKKHFINCSYWQKIEEKLETRKAIWHRKYDMLHKNIKFNSIEEFFSICSIKQFII